MTLPADFDRDLWPDPLMFQGLVGASGVGKRRYRDMFRADGFCKPLSELRLVPWIAKHIDRELARREEWRRNHTH